MIADDGTKISLNLSEPTVDITTMGSYAANTVSSMFWEDYPKQKSPDPPKGFRGYQPPERVIPKKKPAWKTRRSKK